MALLKDTAQATMDLYYQSFKADEDFFDLNDFKYLNSVAYADFLQKYYDDNYKKNLAEKGIGDVEFSDDLFILEEAEVKFENGVYFTILKQKPYSFLHDNNYRAIQNIFPPADAQCKMLLARVNSMQVNKLDTLPTTKYTFWYRLGEKIIFVKVKCGIGKVTVQYIPSLGNLEDDAQFADAMQKSVIDATLDLMFAARNGTTVNLSNNQNTNKALETEIGNIFQGLKTKNG